MLTYALILLSLAGESAGDENDLRFVESVESFVHGTKAVHEFEQVLPADQAAMIRRLGCEHYECREAAEREVTSLGELGLRAIVWGRWSKDAEIHARCDRLRSYLLCLQCDGTGLCEVREAEGYCSQCSQEWVECRAYHCHVCHGRNRLLRPDP